LHEGNENRRIYPSVGRGLLKGVKKPAVRKGKRPSRKKETEMKSLNIRRIPNSGGRKGEVAFARKTYTPSFGLGGKGTD